MGLKDKLSDFIEIAQDVGASSGLRVIKDFHEKVFSLAALTGKRLHDYIPEMLQDQTFYRGIVDYLNQNLGKHLESEAAHKIIDGIAHSKEVGGALYHRLTDQRHTIVGAFDALSKEAPEIQNMGKIKDTFLHLWADFHSVRGLPIFSLNLEHLDQLSEALGLSKSVIVDFLTFNSVEFLSTALSVIPTIYNFNEMQSQDFAKAAARLGILTLGGGQFEALSSVISLSMLGKAFFEAKNEGISNLKILKNMGIEGGFTGLSLGATSILPFPFSLAAPVLIVGIKQKVHDVGFEAAYNEYHESLWAFTERMMDRLGDFDISEIDLASILNK